MRTLTIIFCIILLFSGCSLIVGPDDNELAYLPEFLDTSSRGLDLTPVDLYVAIFSPILRGFTGNPHGYQIGQTYNATVMGVAATISTSREGEEIEYTIDLGPENGLITIVLNTKTKSFTFTQLLIIRTDETHDVNGYFVVYGDLVGEIKQDLSYCGGELLMSCFTEEAVGSGDFAQFNGIDGILQSIMSDEVAISYYRTYYQADPGFDPEKPTLHDEDFTVENLWNLYSTLKELDYDTTSYGYGPSFTLYDKILDTITLLASCQPDSTVAGFQEYYEYNLLDYYTGTASSQTPIHMWFSAFYNSL
jgi:hypothetical protein